MTPLKKIEVVFFRTPAGLEPVRDWLLRMPREDCRRIGDDIRMVEFGWPLGMPTCRPLRGGLYEVRTNLKDAIARTIFAVEDGDMVLLHGFIKKSRKAPKVELDLARDRWKRYRSLHE